MRLRSVLPALLTPALCLPAQQPIPTPTPTPPVPPQTEPPAEQPPPPAPTPTPPPPPVDEAKAAAELLRKRLGLQPGPQGPPPAGPPTTPAAPTPAEAPTTAPMPPQGQEPAPGVDPTEAARRALERLLPTATPPPVAPMPDATGTPEPVLPGAAAAAPRQAPPLPAADRVPVSGMLWTRYRVRHGGGATDQDLVARLTVDVGRSDRDDFTFHASARGFVDVDGQRANDPFPGLDHSFLDDVNGRLYRAHVDAHRLPGVELARLGRQDLDETPVPLSFDGLRLDSERFGVLRAWLSAYGGIPVHQFESSSRGDSVYGMALGLVPWANARLRLDAMDLRDEYLATDRHDSVLGVRWWQALGEVMLNGLHTWVDGNPRDLQVGARADLDVPLRVAVDYRGLLTTQRSQVTELDLFIDIGADYAPFHEVDTSVGTDFGEFLALDLGADVRRLADASDERTFNREFERYYVDVTLLDLGLRGLSLTMSGSVWESTGESFRTVAGDLEYRPHADLRLTLGTGYDLFRYDPLQDRERLHVRSWYLRVEQRVDAALRVDGGYDYERDDFDEWHLFRLGMTWTF